MNVSESRSEQILDFLSLDGWIPTQNATALGSIRVKQLSSVIEKGRSFRNISVLTESPAQSLKSPTKQGQTKSEPTGSVAVKGMVLSVHDTYSTIKRMPIRMQVTASKDEPEKQTLDHLVNNSLTRIEDDLPTSNDLAHFVHQMLMVPSHDIKSPAQTPIQLFNAVPMYKTPLESTLNVSLAPWHFERLRSPDKLAVFHASMQQKLKDSKVSIFGKQIIENVKGSVHNLPTGLNGDVSFPGLPFDILSSKLSDETNEISKLKTTLDAKVESARSLGVAVNTSNAKTKKAKSTNGSKTKKKSADTKTTSAGAEKNEKSKKKSNKGGKQKKTLGVTDENLDTAEINSDALEDDHNDDSDEDIASKGTSIKAREGMKSEGYSGKGWDAEIDKASDEDGEVQGEENQKTSATLSQQHIKPITRKVVKLVPRVADGALNLDAGGSKSLTDSELLVKLKYALNLAQKSAGNAAQLMSAHQALASAEVYLADLKSRISGFGIVGHAERPMLIAFRQGSYRVFSVKGNMCMVLRMFSEAIDTYSRALEFCDWMPEVLFLRAQAYMKKGDIASAQKDLEAAKSIVRDGFVDKSQNPSQFQFQNNTYASLVESMSDSIASAQSVLTAFDDEELSIKKTSKQQALVEQIPSAIILDGSGNHEEWPRNRVFMLASECDSMIHSGHSEEVIQKCDAFLAEDNSIGLIWALRGRALLVLGKTEEGLRNLNRGVTCWGACYECRLYRALAYRQSDPSAAESDLDMCTQMSCCGAIVYILRASIKESMQQNAAAAIDWDLASRKDAPRRNEYRFRACKLLFEDNRRSDCLHMLERLRSSSPHYIATYLLHADLLVKMGNQKGAISTLSRALMIESWNPLLYFKRAQILMMNDRSEDSMRDLVMFFRLYSVATQGFKGTDENSAKTAVRLEVSMIELHCKALISLHYWQDVILLLQQNEKLVAESCSLQVKQ
jgi:tetratricopeptide (TPR) repeat protein